MLENNGVDDCIASHSAPEESDDFTGVEEAGETPFRGLESLAARTLAITLIHPFLEKFSACIQSSSLCSSCFPWEWTQTTLNFVSYRGKHRWNCCFSATKSSPLLRLIQIPVAREIALTATLLICATLLVRRRKLVIPDGWWESEC